MVGCHASSSILTRFPAGAAAHLLWGQAQAYLVLAAAADVDVGQQRANSGLNFDQNYIEAKKYLTTLIDTFVNVGGQLQKVFTVKDNEADDSGKYARYNALQLLLLVMAEGARTGAVRRPGTICDIVCIRQTMAKKHQSHIIPVISLKTSWTTFIPPWSQGCC
jgi:hypothetical protein